MVSKNILKRRKKRREKNWAELKSENMRLKKIIARTERKIEHQCIDFSCPVCDSEMAGDGVWELCG